MVILFRMSSRLNSLYGKKIFLFFQAEDGIRYIGVSGVQTCALPILVVCDVMRFLLFASIPLVGTLLWLMVASFLIEAISLIDRKRVVLGERVDLGGRRIIKNTRCINCMSNSISSFFLPRTAEDRQK